MARGLLLLLSVLALTAPLAAAQDDDVIVDPGSPSGKEYALPVDSARQQAAGKKRTKGSAAQPAPLFGEGVEDESAAAAAPGAGGPASGASSAGGSERGGSGGAKQEERARPQRERAGETLRAQAATPAGGIGIAAIAGTGLGVVLVGAAIGLLLRRRSAAAA